MDVLGSTTTYMVGLQHTLFVGCCYGCARLNNNFKYISLEFCQNAMYKAIYISMGIGPTKLQHCQEFIACSFMLISPTINKGNESDPANYRPVSLTSIHCKMPEHIIHTNIMRYPEKYKVLNDE